MVHAPSPIFGSRKRLHALQAIHDGIRGLAAHHLHFVETTGTLDANQRQRLDSLLQYGPPAQGLAEGNALSIYTAPRFGTISPWSSKATDIAHNCGLAAVKRIERGTHWQLDSTAGALDAQTIDQLACVSCMTR
ncbi:MAG: hypothetical protein U1F34_05260 [Gammaproteobacteria bacterium]